MEVQKSPKAKNIRVLRCDDIVISEEVVLTIRKTIGLDEVIEGICSVENSVIYIQRKKAVLVGTRKIKKIVKEMEIEESDIEVQACRAYKNGKEVCGAEAERFYVSNGEVVWGSRSPEVLEKREKQRERRKAKAAEKRKLAKEKAAAESDGEESDGE